MKKTEMVQIMTLLAGNYESIANKSQNQKELMFNTWYECLGDLDYNLVLQSVKKCMMESSYPPTIHDIRSNAIEMSSTTPKITAIEAWNEAYLMICNGLYMREEEFEKASPEVKKFFGNVRQVRELAKTDLDTVNTVTKGQFLKQYEIISERQKQERLLPEQMQNYIKQLSNKFEMKQLEKGEID